MKILILSYHYPPFNVIASFRAKAYADYLPKFGHEVTVITHPWKEVENNVETDYCENLKVIRIPRLQLMIGKLFRVFNRIPVIKTLSHFVFLMFGYLDGNNVMFDFYYQYRKQVEQLLKTEKFDLVLAIFSPYQHLKLAYYLYQRYHIPYVLDFRDLYDNRILNDQYKPGWENAIQNFLRLPYLKRWLKHSAFSLSTSEDWANHLVKLGAPEGYEILNGYEHEFFENYSRVKTDKFQITYAGTIHPYQDWNGYLYGITEFIESKDEIICLNFIGVDENFMALINNWVESLEEEVKLRIQLDMKTRVDKSTVIDYFSKASLLLLPTLKDRKGMVSGKTLEYIATGVPILSYPSDGEVISKLIKNAGAGFVVESQDEISEVIESVYQKWKEDRVTSSAIRKNGIRYYSREQQVKKLAGILKEKFEKNG